MALSLSKGLFANGESHMPAWFYILRLQSGHLYPGATTDLNRRWQEHQSGIAGRTTQMDPPVALVYQEQHETFTEARKREAQIKRWSRAKKEALVSGDMPRLRRLAVSRTDQCDGAINKFRRG